MDPLRAWCVGLFHSRHVDLARFHLLSHRTEPGAEWTVAIVDRHKMFCWGKGPSSVWGELQQDYLGDRIIFMIHFAK